MDDDIDFQETNIKDDDMTMFWMIILSRHKENLTDHSARKEFQNITYESFLSGIV